ncbi:MAG: hypothetical protein Q8R13_01350, partial [bacterium]|nr:hypothetical protein [bacterium]
MSSTKLGKKVLSVTLATSTTLWLSGLSLIAPIASAAAPGNLMDGDTFRVGTDAKVYIAKMVGDKYFKRWVMTPDIFNVYGHLSWSAIKSISQADADMYVETKLVRVESDPMVWYLDGMTRRHVANPDAFNANGWDWQAVYQINAKEAAFYAEGAQITGAIGPSPSPSTVAGTVLQVGTPATQTGATTLVSGSTAAMGAESLRDVMKIKFTAGDSDVKVKKVVLTRGGISADSDINDMYLYDGSTRLAETPAVSSSKITFSNSSGIFTVNSGVSKEITVKLDLTSNTAGGKTINFSVAAATDVETDGATVSGTFPVASNTHSTANVTDIGRMLFQNSYPSAATTVDPQNDLDVWRFTAAASNQDVEIRRMRITFVGTIASTDLVNVKLLDGGVQVGSTIANLDSNKVADFDLSGSPLKVKSGQTKTLTVRADVVGGTNRTFRASVQKRADVEVYDAGYKVWIRPMTSSTADTFSIMQPNSSSNFSGTNRDFTINTGTLTVTVATDSPSGNVANGATSVALARYDFKAAGEDIKVTDLVVCLDYSGGEGANDGLANGKVFVNSGSGTEYVQVGTTDSNLNVDDTAPANCDNTQDFNSFTLGSQLIVKAGTTRQVEIRADIVRGSSSGTATASGDTYVIALNAGNSSDASNAQGLTSLTSLTVPAADLSARTVTNSAAAISVAKNEGLADYTTSNPLVIGQSNAKIASIAITAGSGEGIDLNSIILQANGTDGREWGRNFTNLKLCKSGTACSSGNQIGSTAASLSTTDEAETKTFTVSPAVVITSGTQYIIDVHADVLSSASDTGLSIVGVRVAASGVTGTGKTTGTSVSAPTAVTSMQNVYISAGGTMSITAAPSSDLPVAQIYTMTPTGASAANEVVVGKFRLNPQFEDFDVERIILNDTFTVGMGSTTASSTLRNVRLYSGSVASTNLVAGPVNPVSTITPAVGAYVDFNGGFKTGGGLTAS